MFFLGVFFQSLSWHPKTSFRGKQDSFWRLSCLYLPYNPLWVVVWEMPPRQNDEPCFLHYCQISFGFAGAAFWITYDSNDYLEETKRDKWPNLLNTTHQPSPTMCWWILVLQFPTGTPCTFWGPAILTQPKETFRSCRCRLGKGGRFVRDA